MVVYSIPAVGVMLTNRVTPDFFVWFTLTYVFISCWKTRTQLFKVVKGLELWQVAARLSPEEEEMLK